MTQKNPSYITKNRLGIYYFQYAIPTALVQTSKRLFRKSLQTRDRKIALRKARLLWLIMDKLKEKYFSSPGEYGLAMELLAKYDSYGSCTWHEIEEQFLSRLEDDEDDLLERAIKYRKAQETEAENQVQGRIKDLKVQYHEKFLEYISKIQIASATAPKVYTPEEDPLLSVLIEKWLAVKSPNLKVGTYASVEKNIHTFRDMVVEILGKEPTISALSEPTIRTYKEKLAELPAIRTAKEFKGKTLLEMTALGRSAISPKTLQGYLTDAVAFLSWSRSEGFPVNEMLATILGNRQKAAKKNKRKKLPFSDADIEIIFNNYATANFKNSADYWAPLISLYTGARRGEICQLLTTDIKQDSETKIWIFDITDESDDDSDEDNLKSLKTESGSKRQVPIHAELIRLGILKYRDARLENSDSRLFPDEVRDENLKFSRFTKRFGYNLKKLGITTTLQPNTVKSFHSFRHTVRTRLVDARVDRWIIDGIIGHTSESRSEGDKSYTHTQIIAFKKEGLAKLKYPTTIKTLSLWDSHEFGRALNKKTRGVGATKSKK